MTNERPYHPRLGKGHVKGDNLVDGVYTHPEPRPHRVNVRIDSTLYSRLRRESGESGRSLSAVMRLALARGVEVVAAERATRQALADVEVSSLRSRV